MKMKYISLLYLFTICTCFTLKSFAQQSTTSSYYSTDPEKRTDSSPRKTYLSLGSGLNNSLGLAGIALEQNFFNRVSLFAGAGLGSWGYKLSFGTRLYLYYPLKSAFGLSYSMATGIDKVPVNLETSNGTKQDVNLQLSAVHLINITYLRFWRLGKRNRFNIEAGYSFALNKGGNYKVLDSGVTLSDNAVKVINFIEPGGFSFGVGFSFGL